MSIKVGVILSKCKELAQQLEQPIGLVSSTKDQGKSKNPDMSLDYQLETKHVLRGVDRWNLREMPGEKAPATVMEQTQNLLGPSPHSFPPKKYPGNYITT